MSRNNLTQQKFTLPQSALVNLPANELSAHQLGNRAQFLFRLNHNRDWILAFDEYGTTCVYVDISINGGYRDRDNPLSWHDTGIRKDKGFFFLHFSQNIEFGTYGKPEDDEIPF